MHDDLATLIPAPFKAAVLVESRAPLEILELEPPTASLAWSGLDEGDLLGSLRVPTARN